MPISRRTLLLAAVLTPPARVAAQPATPVDIEATLADHVAWVMSLFDGGAADLTPAEVEARFDANFRSLVPPAELIATIRQLADQLGPIELVEDQSTDPGEFVGVFRSESGDGVLVSIAVDPNTGLIAGFFITPATLPRAATPVASPAASPVAAGPVVDDPDAQIARYADTMAAIREIGEPAVAAVQAGDDAALAPLLAPSVVAALGASTIADVVTSYTTRRLAMTFAEAGAHFFGQWNNDTISGVMMQNGAPFPFTLTARTPQRGDLPAGRWSGQLDTITLELAVTFDTDGRGNLLATLDIPQQGVDGAVMANVTYREDQPVGERVDERVFGAGSASDSYTVDHAWSDARLRVVIGVDVSSGKVTSLQVLPSVPVPPASDAAEATGAYRLPCEGTWWVFWGGETELRNYHVSAPPQRYAYDLVIWNDGATYRGAGAVNEDYWAWAQPALAPVDGEVVHAVDGLEDLAPNVSPAERAATIEPAGNHVVIRVAEREHVVVAHLRRGTVRVQPGDRIAAGDPLGLVGNSGNTSEPHIHIHVQSTPLVIDPAAAGIPLRFASLLVDGKPAGDAAPVQGSFVANP